MKENDSEQKDKNEERLRFEEKPKDYFQYNLKGIIIHMGECDSGHYYSLIKDRERKNNQWYEFNDNIVKNFDENDISNEAFGGEEDWGYFNN